MRESGHVGDADWKVLRVLTWNIDDHRGDEAALGRVLRACRADVVCLQEAFRRPWSRSRLPRLAQGVALLHLVGGRGSGGTALLVGMRTVVRDPRAVRLPVRGVLTRTRGYAGAHVAVLGRSPVYVASVHLGLDAAERLRHVDLVLAGAPDGALVVAGDLNERPGGPSWQRLGRRVADAGAVARGPQGPGGGADAENVPTFPARRPRARIDAVLVSSGVQVLSCGPPAGVDESDVAAASDHWPVLAEIVLPPAPGSARPADDRLPSG